MSSCSSREFSSGSLKISHHLPRKAASAGWATVQSPVSLDWLGDSLEAAAGACGEGAWYFGPTTQPDTTSRAAAQNHFALFANFRRKITINSPLPVQLTLPPRWAPIAQ